MNGRFSAIAHPIVVHARSGGSHTDPTVFLGTIGPRCSRSVIRNRGEDPRLQARDESDNAFPDAQTLVEKGKRVRDSEWVELDDRVETFLKATGSVDEREIEMQYYPAEGTVVFDGPHGETKTIDVDEMQDVASESIQCRSTANSRNWRFSNRSILVSIDCNVLDPRARRRTVRRLSAAHRGRRFACGGNSGNDSCGSS